MIFPVTIKPYCQLKEENSQYIYRENQRWQGGLENGHCDPLSQKFGILIPIHISVAGCTYKKIGEARNNEMNTISYTLLFYRHINLELVITLL